MRRCCHLGEKPYEARLMSLRTRPARIMVSGESGWIEAVVPGGTEVFDPAALTTLLQAVVRQHKPVRTAVRLAGYAVKEAVIAGKGLIEETDVEAALIDGV